MTDCKESDEIYSSNFSRTSQLDAVADKSHDLDFADSFLDSLRKGHRSELQDVLSAPDFDPNSRDGLILRETISLGYLNLVEPLLAKGADPNLRGDGGRTALFDALENEYFDVAELLLTHGAEISARDERGWTPLIWASIKGYPRVVEFLIERAADLHICSEDGWNAVTGAFFKKHKGIVNLLAKNGARFGRKYMEAALLSAYDFGAYDVVRNLIEDGVNTNIGSSDGQPLLITVLHRGDAEILQLLLEAGADPNIRDTDGNPALLSAILAAQYSSALTLLQSGASVNVKGPRWAPIHVAAERGQVELCEALLDAGAAVDQLGYSGKSALMLATERAHFHTVKLLLDHNADPNLRDTAGKSVQAFTPIRSNEVDDLLRERSAQS